AFFPPPERRQGANSEWRSGNRKKGGGRPGFDPSTRYSLFATRSGSQQIPISDRLKRTAVVRPRGGHPLRETVLLMTLFNHPGLLHTHLDEFAHLDLGDRDLTALQAAMLEIVAGEGDGEAANLRESLGSGRFAGLIARLDQ